MPELKKIFVSAMDCEADAIVENFTGTRTETAFGRRVIYGEIAGESSAVVVSGIGKSNAAAATQYALSLGAGVLINAGVAGGLRAEMKVAELYEVRAAVQYDFDLCQLNGTSIGTLAEYRTPELPLATAGLYPQAVLGTGDRFNDDEKDFLLLHDTLGASLRDMEGGAIAHVALRAQRPCYMLKCVSDVHGSGSTTDQYTQNLGRALKALSAAIVPFFKEVK